MDTLTPNFLHLTSKVAFSPVLKSKFDSLYLAPSATSYAINSPTIGNTYTAEAPPSFICTVLKNLVPKYSGSAASLNLPSITLGIYLTASVEVIASAIFILPIELSP